MTEAIRDIHSTSTSKSQKKGIKAEPDEDMPSFGTSELLSLVRRGARTLANQEIDVNEMLSWDWNTMLNKCKNQAVDGSTGEIKEETESTLR